MNRRRSGECTKGEPVVKYGKHIGAAACIIEAGEHVHIHHVRSRRENPGAEDCPCLQFRLNTERFQS